MHDSTTSDTEFSSTRSRNSHSVVVRCLWTHWMPPVKWVTDLAASDNGAIPPPNSANIFSMSSGVVRRSVTVAAGCVAW